MRQLRARSLRHALTQGTVGVYEDAIAFTVEDWGFDPANIRVPVRIWHGQRDTMVDPAFGRRLAHTVPHSKLMLCRDAGHYLLYTHWERILSTAVRDNAEPSSGRMVRVAQPRTFRVEAA